MRREQQTEQEDVAAHIAGDPSARPSVASAPVRRPASLLAWIRGNVRARIILPTSVLFAGTIAVMIVSLLSIHERRAEGEQWENAETVAVFAEALLENALLTPSEHWSPVEDFPARFSAGVGPGVDAISYVASTGEISFSSRRDLVGTAPWVEPAGIVAPTRVVPARFDGDQFGIIQPFGEGGKCRSCHELTNAGWVEVRFRRSEEKNPLTVPYAIAAVPVLLALLGIAWWLLGTEVTGPLRRLSKAMEQAQAGDKEVVADEGRPGELGDLARAFDATMAALHTAQAEVEASHRQRLIRVDRFAAIGELATGLAHEIRNPLAGIAGALEILGEDLKGSPEQAAIVDEVFDQVIRLAATMESMLNFARPQRLELRSVDLNECVEAALFLVEAGRPSSAGGLEVRRELDASLSPAWADTGQLEQALLNLMLNAVQAMGDVGGVLTARTYARGDRLVAEIQDTGPGIPEEVRPHLFEPYFTTRKEGTGLGLALSARIISDHEGELDYECPEEGGTVFRISVPMCESEQRRQEA